MKNCKYSVVDEADGVWSRHRFWFQALVTLIGYYRNAEIPEGGLSINFKPKRNLHNS